MVLSPRAKGAIAAGAILAIGGGAAAYLLTRAAAVTPGAMCFVPPSGACSPSVTYSAGDAMLANVTAPAGSPPVSVQAFINGVGASVHPWSVAATGLVYQIDFGDVTTSTPTGVTPVYAVVTFANGSTMTTNTCSVTISSTATSCTGVQVPCYSGGVLQACCPPGEHCVGSNGVCPTGTVPDPNNPGCCISTSPTVYPREFVGPTGGAIDADGSYCQPVNFAGLFWQCCGTPVTSKPEVSFTVRLYGSDGLPMTGAVVTASVDTVLGAPTTYTDQGSYTTDANGYIYPTVTVDFLPTDCNPADQGTLKPAADPQVSFTAESLPPASGGPELTVTIFPRLAFRTATYGGACGTC